MQPPRFDGKEAAERVATPGVAVGLVWTAVGGEVQFVEATTMIGKGNLHLTGQLGDVIKESAQIALTWVSLFALIRTEVDSTYLHCEYGVLVSLELEVRKPAGASRGLTRETNVEVENGDFNSGTSQSSRAEVASRGGRKPYERKGRPYPLPCRCSAQGWSFSWCDFGDCLGVFVWQTLCTSRHCYDWRNDIKGSRAPSWWRQGQGTAYSQESSTVKFLFL